VASFTAKAEPFLKTALLSAFEPPKSSTVMKLLIDETLAEPFCLTQKPFKVELDLPVLVICKYETGTELPALTVPPNNNGIDFTARVVAEVGVVSFSSPIISFPLAIFSEFVFLRIGYN